MLRVKGEIGGLSSLVDVVTEGSPRCLVVLLRPISDVKIATSLSVSDSMLSAVCLLL